MSQETCQLTVNNKTQIVGLHLIAWILGKS